MTKIFLAVCIAVLICAGCSTKTTEPELTTGILTGAITDAETTHPISGVRIIVFDANTNAPVGASISTSLLGGYRMELDAGTYYLKLAKQGYENLPPRDIAPMPLKVARGDTTRYSVSMYRSQATGTGAISGRAAVNGEGIAGVSVVASGSGQGYSSVTDGIGNYVIYNVPPDTYSVRGWIAGYTSNAADVVITPDTLASNVNLLLTAGGSGAVQGKITFLATTNIEVDVALTNPQTRETIPGLSVMTASQNYVISGAPPGIYLARATYANDGKVMDPDWIIKNGEPFITVGTDTATRDFSVTGSVELIGPTNPPTDTQPAEIQDTLPLFSWNSYSSADNYIIEVINAGGKVIWGGFDSNWTVRRVVIPKTQTSVRFDDPAGTTRYAPATERLAHGKIYRWKVYVSKDDSGEPTGWKLISVSEDQMGLLKIVP